MNTVAAIGAALLSALLFALAAVAQQTSAAADPHDRGLRMLARLVRDPRWLAGSLGDTAAFAMQAVALGFGSLLLVQPIIVTQLVFALPLAARWAGRRPSRAELTWATVLVVALVLFVTVGEPTAGVDRAGLAAWAPTGSVLLVLFAACLLAARVTTGTPRALLLAAATGIAYGVVAALTLGVVDTLSDGLVALLTSWETWVLVVAVVGGTLLQQSAFQAGALGASLPAVVVGEPVVAAVVGVTVLDERLDTGGAGWLLVGVLVVVLVVATIALARASARTGNRV
ncbi:DMT family transporter [Pseudonocardia sp. ICBG601]|uniref:DMT family transporter n=1 Tax=Pseudonocardia sp. ICBG601 TaxID=2846759 RepID=UPI001CF70E23|nr:DMT family transporter [Pseudonocardia sp. ICBG601]